MRAGLQGELISFPRPARASWEKRVWVGAPKCSFRSGVKGQETTGAQTCMSAGQREHGWTWVKASGNLQKQMVLLGQKDSHCPVQSQSLITAQQLGPSSWAAQQDLPAWETWAAQDITPGMSTLGSCPRARDSRSCHHPRLCVACAREPLHSSLGYGVHGRLTWPHRAQGRCRIWHGK